MAKNSTPATPRRAEAPRFTRRIVLGKVLFADATGRHVPEGSIPRGAVVVDAAEENAPSPIATP